MSPKKLQGKERGRFTSFNEMLLRHTLKPFPNIVTLLQGNERKRNISEEGDGRKKSIPGGDLACTTIA
jgi:hypothetical protein